MAARLNVLWYGIMFFAFLALTGCPPPATTQPAAAPAPQPSAAKPAPSSSSLEAARRGEPAASPLKDIYFDFDKSELRPEARNALKENGDWLKRNGSARVEIEGHCDERGTTEYNLALGARRAQAAKDYLSSLGVAKERISTISYGKELPVCKEHNEECWQKNRRDHFAILPARPAS